MKSAISKSVDAKIEPQELQLIPSEKSGPRRRLTAEPLLEADETTPSNKKFYKTKRQHRKTSDFSDLSREDISDQILEPRAHHKSRIKSDDRPKRREERESRDKTKKKDGDISSQELISPTKLNYKSKESDRGDASKRNPTVKIAPRPVTHLYSNGSSPRDSKTSPRISITNGAVSPRILNHKKVDIGNLQALISQLDRELDFSFDDENDNVYNKERKE